MQILLTERFLSELESILDFIALDSIPNAFKFQDDLEHKLYDIPAMPYQHRQSSKMEDINIRELVFKGYVIPYRIKDDRIEILGIFNQNEWEI